MVCFSARQVGAGDHATLVERCWNLPELAQRYHDFLVRWRARTEEVRGALAQGTLSDVRAFVLRFQLIHEYRLFPLDDPYLPAALLPEEWPCWDATALFNRGHDLLATASDRYVAEVLSREPSIQSQPRPTPA